jgi:putative aminopeptidase FrvX
MVKVGDEEGLSSSSLWAVWDQVLLGQRVVIHTHRGLVTGSSAPSPAPATAVSGNRREAGRQFVDVGASGKEQVEELGCGWATAYSPTAVR